MLKSKNSDGWKRSESKSPNAASSVSTYLDTWEYGQSKSSSTNSRSSSMHHYRLSRRYVSQVEPCLSLFIT